MRAYALVDGSAILFNGKSKSLEIYPTRKDATKAMSEMCLDTHPNVQVVVVDIKAVF